jgi:antitoxin StbD
VNAPFRPDTIHDVLADACVSISGLKRNPAAVIAEAQQRQVAILNRNRPVAYVIAPHVWEHLCDLVEDQKLADLVEERQAEIEQAIPVDLADL